MIIVIDYDAGNTANVLRALEKIGVTAELSADKEKILAADGLILPGVGVLFQVFAVLFLLARSSLFHIWGGMIWL